MPLGPIKSIAVTQNIIFAFSLVKLIGTTTGEYKNFNIILLKVINSIIFHISIFLY
ncbi:hypothetical protein ONB71_01030 [Candidatus Purcelliella pentastirinorum]|uniref:Uncharacterized protein n=1 Tax=Candidatus Purcelliella pentastirinorum TaxID=472834 RepID=A0AAX3N8C6_9ENTR|nr:hypothetical protein [Candidatus Purcelliella pentastirinorum]WDI78709.1 hypothetical protein ONB71_01030 [Candidatus Purcelliella pentastirinorum]